MNDNTLDLQTILKKHSEYSSIKALSDDDADEIIGLYFQGQINSLLATLNNNTFSKYGDNKVEVFFEFIKRDTLEEDEDPPGFDVFVVPIAALEQPHCFAVFISTELITSLTKIHSTIELGPEVALETLSVKEVEALFRVVFPRVFSTLTFLFFHEYGHVMQAHFPFLFPQRYENPAKKSFLSLHQIKTSNDAIKLNQTRLHRAIEMDADLASISLIVRFLSMESAEAPDFFLKEIIEEPEIIGESISILIGVMELWRKTFSVTPYSKERVLHPHPDIRQIFLSSWLTTRRPEDHSDRFFEIASAIHKGMEAASDKVAKLGSSFLPYFSHLKNKDKHEIENECEEIRQDLYDKLRPTLSTFSI